MAWGSVQEATSILAALNYLGARNATVEEAGLQPLEALCEEELSDLLEGLPPIGASPDGCRTAAHPRPVVLRPVDRPPALVGR
eukprot:5222476-Prymnesium_polylepis.1